MAFSGDLREIGLADVFQNIAGNRTSGWLEVEWRQRHRRVWFVGGRVAGFAVGDGPLLSPEFLAQRGFVDPEAMQKVGAKLKRSKKTPAEIAGRMKLLDAQDVQAAVATSVCEHVYDLMLVREATFEFNEGDPPEGMFDADQVAAGLGLEVGPLLMEGARRRDELQRIRRLIGTDRDLVLLLEGWEDVVGDPLAQEVAERLDGTMDARMLMQHVRASRFDVMKTLADLVESGAARLATAEELAEFADEACRNQDVESAVRLLEQALAVERTNDEIRERLVDLLTDLGRTKEASAQLAQMAHRAATDGDVEQALEQYGRAYELDPEDVPLLEQKIELLRELGDDGVYAEGVRELVRVYLHIGLADRARDALRTAVGRPALRNDESLLGELGRVESSLGRYEVAARIYRQLGEQLANSDEDRALEWLHAAVEQTPSDDALAKRVRDLESGRARKMRARRRKLVNFVVVLAVGVGLGAAGIIELRAMRRVIDAFDRSLELAGGGDAVAALGELDEVVHGGTWSLTRGRAVTLFERLADLQFDDVERKICEGDFARARTVLSSLLEEVGRGDVRVTCEKLLERVDTAEDAAEILGRADREGDADPVDLSAVASLTDPAYLDFHLAYLPRVDNAQARHAVLRALDVIDSSRAIPTVARLFLTEPDPQVAGTMRGMLERSQRFRGTADWRGWGDLHTELTAAVLVDETRERARVALGLVFGREDR